MPELPEVETVRRGLAPAMEGARFTKVELRRGDLRWPLPKDFAQRLEGKTVTGLGRRAKYLLADLSSGDVLVMHLGMSGSFHVFRGGGNNKLGRYHHERAQHAAHDHVVFHMSSGAIVTFNDPRRFGSMKLVARGKARRRAAAGGTRPRAARQCLRRRDAGASLQGKKTSLKAALLDQRSSPGSATFMSARRCIARGFRPSASPRRSPSKTGAPNERAERLVEGIKAVLNDAIKAGGSSLRDHKLTDGELGMFQHHFRVYDREGEKCRDARLPRHDQTHRAEWPLDVLLSGMPEVTSSRQTTPEDKP